VASLSASQRLGGRAPSEMGDGGDLTCALYDRQIVLLFVKQSFLLGGSRQPSPLFLAPPPPNPATCAKRTRRTL